MPLATACLDCNTPTQGRICPRCQRIRRSKDPYQDPAWRARAKALTRGKECAICGSTNRLTAHHREGREVQGMYQGAFLVLCASHHSQYESHKRAGKQTELVRIIESL